LFSFAETAEDIWEQISARRKAEGSV
jgi:hypothetical protein